MSAPVPVLHLIWALTPGGAERQAVELAKGLHGERFQVHVGCLTQTGALASELTAHGIEVFCLNKRPGLDLTLIRRLADEMHERRIRLLHAHMFTASFWGRFAAGRAGATAFMHEHSTHTLDKRWRIWLDRLFLRGIRRIVCVSDDLKTRFLQAGYPAGKVRLIRNGIRLDGWLGTRDRAAGRKQWSIPENAAVAVVVGSLEPRKDHATLLKAMVHAHTQIDNARPLLLLIVGDGPLRGDLEAQARAIPNIEIRFVGEQQDVRPALWASDVYVSSSVTEGTSIALLEAMAAGTPVVATNVGGNPEVLDYGACGRLCPAQNPEALGAAIAQCVIETDVSARLTAAAEARVRAEYDKDAMLAQFADLYETFLAEAR